MGADLMRREGILSDTLSEIEEFAGQDLRKVMCSGPRTLLKETHIAQLAIFGLGIGTYRSLMAAGVAAPVAMCGHSLGQFTALTAAGSLSLAEGTMLVTQRGNLMHAQNQRHQGAMMAVARLDRSVIQAALTELQDVWIANDNAPGQIILSGAASQLALLAERIEAAGGSVIRLDVAGAYHTPLMGPAAEAFAHCIAQARIDDPDCPVISNSDATVMRNSRHIRADLTCHMLAPVLWRDSLQTLSNLSVDAGVEIGAGRSMKGLWLRNLPDLPCWTTSDSKDIARTMDVLRTNAPRRETAA
jgi:[acyl-carrier-protein] S-malonyltransferase